MIEGKKEKMGINLQNKIQQQQTHIIGKTTVCMIPVDTRRETFIFGSYVQIPAY